ncbi:MAG TPA: hypothetical protein VMW49_08940 [Candidatus Dormibacteraeota bacterium]|nr:hypothetical protein [Candidatus Dormibacteraeota bacterium]
MVRRLRSIRRLFFELPGQVKLAYCLARDPRMPRGRTLVAGGAVAAILSPALEVPLWIPVIGQLDTLALLLLALRLYVDRAPAELRAELQAQVQAGTSRFDRDLAAGGTTAVRLARWIEAQARHVRPRGRRPPQEEAAPWYRAEAAAAVGPAADGLGETTPSPDPLVTDVDAAVPGAPPPVAAGDQSEPAAPPPSQEERRQ